MKPLSSRAAVKEFLHQHALQLLPCFEDPGCIKPDGKVSLDDSVLYILDVHCIEENGELIFPVQLHEVQDSVVRIFANKPVRLLGSPRFRNCTMDLKALMLGDVKIIGGNVRLEHQQNLSALFWADQIVLKELTGVDWVRLFRPNKIFIDLHVEEAGSTVQRIVEFFNKLPREANVIDVQEEFMQQFPTWEEA